MARIFANLLIWLALTAEIEGFVFHGLWSTPLTAIGSFIFRGQLLSIIPWDLMVVAVIAASQGSRKNRVLEINRAIWITIGGIALVWVWGIARGGNAHQTVWQVHNFVVGALVTAFMVMNTCRTKADLRSLGQVVLFAAIYRCIVLLIFYFSVVMGHHDTLPYLTEHTDSVLFVTGFYVAVAMALERPSAKSITIAVVVAALVVTAIVLNNRRIAWLTMGIGGVVTYVCIPPGKLKRRLRAFVIAMMPVFVAYLAIGWGRPTGIFKPVGSVSSMFGENQDMSSIMRDVENYNLVRTLRTNLLLGTGWGHEYIEEVVAIDISSIFPQYRYWPHNSLLGVIAFTGMVGFGLIWQLVVTALFFHARVLRGSNGPIMRATALWSVVATSAVIVQYWGDLGFNHLGCNVMLGVAIGLAGRLPALAGLWPGTAPALAAASTAASAVPVPVPAAATRPAERHPSEARHYVHDA